MKPLTISAVALAFTLIAIASAQVTTSQYDNARAGTTLREKTLTPQNVNAKQFGKLGAFKVDGAVYAQPLFIPAVEIPGKGNHDVLFVATEHDSVYAFDATRPDDPPLWKVSFLDKSRGTGILATRLRLIVRNKRQAPEPGNIFQCGRLLLKPEIGRAYWDDKDVNLTVSEFKIIYLISSRVGEYVPYRQIYDAMHYTGFVAGSGEHGYRANVRSSIKRIRNKFRECDPVFDEINNYTGFGYCWGKRGK